MSAPSVSENPEIICSECKEVIELSSAYCADDNGDTIHLACYLKQIERRHGQEPMEESRRQA
jgi:hypothetical protein